MSQAPRSRISAFQQREQWLLRSAQMQGDAGGTEQVVPHHLFFLLESFIPY